MIRIRNLLTTILVVLAAALLSPAAWAQDTALIRFVHLDADQPAIDIYINGELAAADLRFGETTTQVNVAADSTLFSTHLPGTSVFLKSTSARLDEGPATIVTTSAENRLLHIVSEDQARVSRGSARLALFNALNADAQVTVGIPDDSKNLVFDLGARVYSNSVETSAGIYDILLKTVSDEREVGQFSQPLSAGTVNLLIIHGTTAEPKLFNAVTAAESGADSGRLRFIHAIEGAAPVDLRMDGQLLVPALSFASPTPHIGVPAGSRDIAVNLGAAEIMSERLQIRAGELSTVVLMRTSAGLGLFHFEDAAADVDESAAVVSLINAIPDSVISHLQLESGAITALNVQSNEAGDAARIVPGRQAMTLHLNIGGERGEVSIPPHYFNGGSYYSLVAVAGSVFSAPRLLIAETSLQRQLHATMPADAMDEAEPSQPDIEEPPVEPAADEPVTEPAAQADAPESDAPVETDDVTEDAVESEVTEETTPPTAETETIAPPKPALTPYAIVNVNQNAALHLRQYPSSQAMSLGLLPAESDLMILGRRGPSQVDGDTPIALPVDLSDFVDHVPALLPYQDLPAADTWLYSMYRTPDNGALYGWVNALYLEVFDLSGEQQRLANLAVIRQNQPGSAYNTEIKPPELSDRIAARVFGLTAGGLLNLRRSNDPASEVLTQLPADVTLRLIGLDEAEAWAFVEFQPETGNAIKGWVSMAYIQLQLNGEPVTAATLRALDPSTVPLISATVTGAVQPLGSAEPAAPMEGIVGQVNVNFDSALHLRRYPDATSESLAMIPPDTLLHLEGVTNNGGWYKVQFQGDEGWVASPYLVLSMDGRKYARAFLEGQLPRFNDLGF